MQDFINKCSTILATGIYSGYLRPAPGTVGSLVGLGIWFVLQYHPWFGSNLGQLLCILGVCAVGWFTTSRYLKQNDLSDDPSEVVIDEWAGLWVALFGVSAYPVCGMIAAFVLFRIFDILKPGPVGWVEQAHGATGIMLDDIVAGLFAAAILHLGVLNLCL